MEIENVHNTVKPEIVGAKSKKALSELEGGVKLD